jgi:DNA polymerase III epsilon subunit-like protein
VYNGIGKRIGIAEIAAQKTVNGATLVFHHWLNPMLPDGSISEAWQEMYGYTAEFLNQQITFAEIASSFVAFIKAADRIVSCQAALEVPHINAALRDAGWGELDTYCKQVTCNAALVKEKRLNKSSSIDGLAEHFGLRPKIKDNSSLREFVALLAGIHPRLEALANAPFRPPLNDAGQAMNTVYLSIETSSLGGDSCPAKIVEIVAMKHVDNLIHVFHQRLNPKLPEQAITPEWLNMVGWSDDFMRTQPTFAAIAPNLVAFFHGVDRIVLAHTAFVLPHLNSALFDEGLAKLETYCKHMDCNLTLAKKCFPEQCDRTIEGLAAHFGLKSHSQANTGLLEYVSLLSNIHPRLEAMADALD